MTWDTISEHIQKLPQWQFAATYKMDNVAGGSVTIKITLPAGTSLIYDVLLMGNNSYAATRVYAATIYDQGGRSVLKPIYNGSVNNQIVLGSVPPVVSNSGTSTTNVIGLPTGYIHKGDDYLQMAASTLAQNEELTILIRGRYMGNVNELPIVTVLSADTSSTIHYSRLR